MKLDTGCFFFFKKRQEAIKSTVPNMECVCHMPLLLTDDNTVSNLGQSCHTELISIQHWCLTGD